jgi:hypothetical protein
VFDVNILVAALILPGGTGDRAMLAPGRFEGAEIITLRDFLRAVAGDAWSPDVSLR